MKSIFRFQAIFLCSIFFSINLFSQQINPDLTMSAGESFEDITQPYTIHGQSTPFKMYKILKESGNNASATSKIRIAFLLGNDAPCTRYNCPNEYVFDENYLEYRLGNGSWQKIARVTTSNSTNGGWQIIHEAWNTSDSYSYEYEYQSSSTGCGFLWLGPCYSTGTNSGSKGGNRYVQGSSNLDIEYINKQTSNNYMTYTFDWHDFPPEFLDGNVSFRYNQSNSKIFNRNFEVNFGDEVEPDNIEIVTNDNEIIINGSSSLSQCASSSSHSRKWFAESQQIYGNSAKHEINLGNWQDDFSLNVKAFDGTNNIGPDVTIDYKLYYREYDKGCAIQRVVDLENISTQELVQADNLIAFNDDNHVRIEWSHLTSCSPGSLTYKVYRRDDPNDETWKQVYWFKDGSPYINYTKNGGTNTTANSHNTLDSHNQFIDETANQDKTYLYKLEVKASTALQNNLTLSTHYQGTGAGIDFFDTNLSLSIDQPKSECGGFSFQGEQALINQSVKFGNEDYKYDPSDQGLILSFSSSDFFGTQGLSQRVYFYEDEDFTTQLLIPGTNDPLEIPGNQSTIDEFDISLGDNELSKTVYATVKARRTDGKWFSSFQPTVITGSRKPTPPPVEIYSASSEDYVTLRLTDIKETQSIDHIKIYRESRIPGAGQNPETDEDVSWSDEFELDSIILSNEDQVQDLIVENGQLVWQDRQDSEVKFPPTIFCNEYKYYIKSSNCNIWASDSKNPDGELINGASFYQEIVSDTAEVSPTLTEDLFESGNPERDLLTSKGEFSHKTHLSWNNNSSGFVDNYTIERREYGSEGESSWIEIGSVTTGEKFFEDEYCEANLLYEYRVKAHVGNCASSSPDDEGAQAATVSSNMIGFRRPVGRITGRIVYNQTSNPVSDVYVKVEPIINEDQTTNRSINLSSSYGIVKRPFAQSPLDHLNKYAITFWFKPSTDNEGVLFSRYSELYEMSLLYSDNKISYREFSGSNDNTYPAINLKPKQTSNDWSWNNVTLTYLDDGDNKTVTLYVNGDSIESYVSQFIPNKMDDFIFGYKESNESFDGLVDEIVLYKSNLSHSQIHDNYFKFLNPIDDDIVFFIPCDEGIGEFAYDVSSNTIGIYNRNHLELHEIGTVDVFVGPDVDNIPINMSNFYSDEHNEELLYLDKSTSSGMYDIRNIRYINDGNNFSITPYTLLDDYDVIHEFLPAQRTDFLGDQSQLISAIDFSDLTSLTVQGKLLYHVTPDNSDLDHVLIDKDINPIGVSDAYVKVGGRRVNNDDGEVKTDENGFFTMSIPIGNQCISFEKNGYTFSYTDDSDLYNDDKFCKDFEFNSNSDLGEFSCNTYKELRGRVTGGNTFNTQIISDINIGFNLPANTIGSVGFTLMPNNASVIDYDGYSVSVVTDSISGEYHVRLLPLMHKINSSSWISSNEKVENHYKHQQYLFPSIDMKVEGVNDENGEFEEDLLFTKNSFGMVVDTFHKRHDIIYRNSPSIIVTQNISTETEWTEFVGEESIKINSNNDALMEVFDSIGYKLPWPVFKERFGNETYRFNIEVGEVYTNYGPLKDGHNHNSYMYKNQDGESVYSSESYFNDVSEGEITINNTMMKSSNTILDLTDLNGSVDYEFNPDNPFVFGKDQGYMRKLIIEYQDGSINAIWPSLLMGQNESQRGDVLALGDESYGNDFFTFGPQTVDMIIRDPNGDGSYAWIEDGSTINRSTTLTNVNGYKKDWKFHIGAGLDMDYGLGFSMGAHSETSFKAKAFATLDMSNSAELKNTSENEISITETYNQTITTNQEDWEVGAKGDLYIGESKNLNFGTSKDLQFIESYKCALGGGIYDCIDYPIIVQTKTFTKEITGAGSDSSITVISNVDATYDISENIVQAQSDTLSSNISEGVTTQVIQEVVSYQVGTKTGASVKPGTTTKFLYSQNYIQNYLLTKLEFIKNTYLLGEYEVHTDLLPIDHECFGEPSSSNCFDRYISNGELTDANRFYYTIPDSEVDDYYEMPNLTNYDINTLTAILGTTYEEFKANYNDADHYIGYSVTDVGINNDQWNNPLISLESETSGFGFSMNPGAIPELVDYLKFVNTGPTFGTGIDTGIDDDTSNDGYANDQQLNTLLMNFAEVQDFTSVPGFINLEELLSGLTIDPAVATESVIIPRDKVQFYAQQIKLWKRAMAMNELDKIESEFTTNHSMNGGASLEQSHISTGTFKNTNSINYDLSSMYGIGGEFSALFVALGFDANFQYNNNFNLEFSTTTSLSAESSIETGYSLSDADQGDVISMDVKQSKYGYGPIFEIQAGATSCPWEDAVYANYIKDFDLYFELKFYDEFMKLNDSIGGGLNFNPETYDFTFSGQLAAASSSSDFPFGELATIKASYNDFSILSKKTANDEPRTQFEKARYNVYQDVVETLSSDHNAMFSSSEEYELSATTSRRDKPTLDVYPYNLYNVPEDDQAVFTLTLGNESEDNTHRIYNLKVVESSNPYGAILKIDGASPNRDFPVMAGSTLTKTLTVEKGPDSLNYENLQIIIYAGCQYEYGTSDEYDIADTISLNVYFLPSCTDIEIFDNDDDWLVNISDENQVSLKLDEYNINYYSLEDIYLDFKFENEPWSPISPQPSIVNPNYIINKEESFKRLTSLDLYNLLHSDFTLNPNEVSELYLKLEPREECKGSSCKIYDLTDMNVHEDWIDWKVLEVDTVEYIQSEISRLKETYLSSQDSNSDHEMLSLRTSSTNVTWNLPSLPKDGSYKIRAKSNCGSYTSQAGDLEDIYVYSSTHDLFSDRIRPELFGSILPVDGVLNADDDIIVTFNEPINEIAFNTSSAETYIEVEGKEK